LQKLKDYLAMHPTLTILVSHDLGEIMQLATHAIVLKKGNIIRKGTPYDVLLRKHISGKFSFYGQIASISKKGLLYEIGVVIDNQLIIVMASEDEAASLNVGAPVLLLAKLLTRSSYLRRITHENCLAASVVHHGVRW